MNQKEIKQKLIKLSHEFDKLRCECNEDCNVCPLGEKLFPLANADYDLCSVLINVCESSLKKEK